MKKLIIPILLIALAGCSNQLGADIKSTSIKQKEVTYKPVGQYSCYNLFEDDNKNIIKEEISQEEYNALGLKGAEQPKKKGTTWLKSKCGREIEIELPPLDDNDFVNYIDKDGVEKTLIKEKGVTKEVELNYIYEKDSNIINSSKPINP